MQLNQHQEQVIQHLRGAGWLTQRQLKTSRQTINALCKAGIVERKKPQGKPRYTPETFTLYRLRVE